MNHTAVLCLVLGLIGWRIYSRFRRSIGRQPLQPTRLKLYVVAFSLLSLYFAVRTLGHPPLMLGWLAGAVPGVLLGMWALRLTRFETTAEGRFYTPNAHIGMALSVLFVLRVAYRMIAIYSNMSLSGAPPKPLGESALTYLTFELLAGYYVAYYLGVLRQYRPSRPTA